MPLTQKQVKAKDYQICSSEIENYPSYQRAADSPIKAVAGNSISQQVSKLQVRRFTTWKAMPSGDKL
jgi:hypothetical protein